MVVRDETGILPQLKLPIWLISDASKVNAIESKVINVESKDLDLKS